MQQDILRYNQQQQSRTTPRRQAQNVSPRDRRLLELSEQLIDQQQMLANHKVYQEQLYSQLEKYVEIIDYTMKLLYKLNEFMKAKSDEAMNYSVAQLEKVPSEERHIVEKLHGLYTLNEPRLEILKGVEEYQIIGEDSQQSIIAKIQGVAKIVVDNIKIIGSNSLQHEKLKFYIAEKIAGVQGQQEKMQLDQKYMTLQLQKEIQLNNDHLKSAVSQSIQQHAHQTSPPINNHAGKSDSNEMWLEVVSKLVEYCTSLQLIDSKKQNSIANHGQSQSILTQQLEDEHEKKSRSQQVADMSQQILNERVFRIFDRHNDYRIQQTTFNNQAQHNQQQQQLSHQRSDFDQSIQFEKSQDICTVRTEQNQQQMRDISQYKRELQQRLLEQSYSDGTVNYHIQQSLPSKRLPSPQSFIRQHHHLQNQTASNSTIDTQQQKDSARESGRSCSPLVRELRNLRMTEAARMNEQVTRETINIKRNTPFLLNTILETKDSNKKLSDERQVTQSTSSQLPLSLHPSSRQLSPNETILALCKSKSQKKEPLQQMALIPAMTSIITEDHISDTSSMPNSQIREPAAPARLEPAMPLRPASISSYYEDQQCLSDFQSEQENRIKQIGQIHSSKKATYDTEVLSANKQQVSSKQHSTAESFPLQVQSNSLSSYTRQQDTQVMNESQEVPQQKLEVEEDQHSQESSSKPQLNKCEEILSSMMNYQSKQSLKKSIVIDHQSNQVIHFIQSSKKKERVSTNESLIESRLKFDGKALMVENSSPLIEQVANNSPEPERVPAAGRKVQNPHETSVRAVDIFNTFRLKRVGQAPPAENLQVIEQESESIQSHGVSVSATEATVQSPNNFKNSERNTTAIEHIQNNNSQAPGDSSASWKIWAINPREQLNTQEDEKAYHLERQQTTEKEKPLSISEQILQEVQHQTNSQASERINNQKQQLNPSMASPNFSFLNRNQLESNVSQNDQSIAPFQRTSEKYSSMIRMIAKENLSPSISEEESPAKVPIDSMLRSSVPRGSIPMSHCSVRSVIVPETHSHASISNRPREMKINDQSVNQPIRSSISSTFRGEGRETLANNSTHQVSLRAVISALNNVERSDNHFRSNQTYQSLEEEDGQRVRRSISPNPGRKRIFDVSPTGVSSVAAGGAQDFTRSRNSSRYISNNSSRIHNPNQPFSVSPDIRAEKKVDDSQVQRKPFSEINIQNYVATEPCQDYSVKGIGKANNTGSSATLVGEVEYNNNKSNHSSRHTMMSSTSTQRILSVSEIQRLAAEGRKKNF